MYSSLFKNGLLYNTVECSRGHIVTRLAGDRDTATFRRMLERTMTHSRIVDIVSTNFMFGRYPIASVVDRFVLRAFRASANLVAIVRKER